MNLLLIGDSCTDEYRFGDCSRMSPEAPVPILNYTHTVEKPGMASNVYENLKAFGHDVHFIHNGEEIRKIRYIDQKSGQHLLRVDHEQQSVPWSGSILDRVHEFDAVVFSDYNKGFVKYEHIETIRRGFHGPIFIDTKKPDLSRFNGCYVKINEVEYKARHSTNDNLIVTLGDKGAMYKVHHYEKVIPSEKVEVIDVCGAGDTFLAAFTTCMLETDDVEISIAFANKCSAITVGHRGVYSLSHEDIARVRNA